MEYIVKLFYPLKSRYPEQIQKLKLLIGELETLKEARQIIDNYKKDYQQFLSDVPEFIIQNDEEGFYERLGFANISESVLNVEYKFVYTSNGYMAQRSFSVPMTEDNIIELIETLENKLTMESFTNDQRALMTLKLRNQIKKRDNYTCQICGNSTYKEPNLLLEVDHIHPISKGGYTIESNLQTLCWKCNRAKSNKI
jgi:rubrerythrin